MHTPFDPHPNWRRNFEFTAAYTSELPTYRLDPIIEESKPTAEFKLDPTLNKFSSAARSQHINTQLSN